jgi:hypothetical protein
LLGQIRDTTTGEVFTGTSPTHPWTAMCLAKGTGTRISGPLFYGFSDPITQQAIALQYTDEEAAAAEACGILVNMGGVAGVALTHTHT